MRKSIVLSLLGGAAGAALLLLTPDDTFRRVVPWLLLAATALFAFGPQIRAWASRSTAPGTPASTLKATAGMLAVAFTVAISTAAWAFCAWHCSAYWVRHSSMP